MLTNSIIIPRRKFFRFEDRPMSLTVTLEMELPDDIARFRLPVGDHNRLQELLERQDHGVPLNEAERAEAEGLVNLADVLTLLRLRAERAGRFEDR
jgi:hypothetical protein